MRLCLCEIITSNYSLCKETQSIFKFQRSPHLDKDYISLDEENTQYKMEGNSHPLKEKRKNTFETLREDEKERTRS